MTDRLDAIEQALAGRERRGAMTEGLRHVVRAVILVGIFVWAIAASHYLVVGLLALHYSLSWSVEIEKSSPMEKGVSDDD